MLMTKVVKILSFFLLIGVPASAFCSTDFDSDETYPYKYFSSKTLYDTVRGEIDSSIRPPGCTPQSIVAVFRHGSRHPGSKVKNQFKLLEMLHARVNVTGIATLCSRDIKKIQLWQNWYDADLDMNLAVTGEVEMTGLSQRFYATFPELFAEEFDQRFTSSNTQRARESARIFRDTSLLDEHEIDINNSLMRSWETCENYITEIAQNKAVTAEVTKFRNGDRFNRIAATLSTRLGIPSELVDSSTAEMIYKIGCTEEEWATGKDSPWCLSFTKEELQAFEYAGDMKYYLTESFGHSVSYRHTCSLKHRILEALKNASNGDESNHFYFGHKPVLLPLLTEMNLIENDGPFRSEDYPAKVDRKFRVALNAPGSGNVAFVLYSCSDGMKLQVLLNEKLLRLPLNSPHENGLWDLEDALHNFGYYNTDDCNAGICSAT